MSATERDFNNGPEVVYNLVAVLSALARWQFLVGQQAMISKDSSTPVCTDRGSSGARKADREAHDPADEPPTSDEGDFGTFDGWALDDVLGEGGMGVVFRARDKKTGRPVALKVLQPRLAADKEARDRFAREARLAAQIRGDTVVAILDVRMTSAIPYLVMELVDGPNLLERLESEGPLRTQDLLQLGIDVADGLHLLHEKTLVHRDVKPSNIKFRRESGRAVLVDFGLARKAGKMGSITQSGEVLGTPVYMSPEQARGESLDARSDLFSLGTVLYIAATGRSPIGEEAIEDPRPHILYKEPDDIRNHRSDLPEELVDIIHRLLHKDRKERYQSAAQVASDLRRLLPT